MRILAAAAAAIVVAFGLLITGAGSHKQSEATPCLPTVGPGGGTAAGPLRADALDPEQRDIATQIIEIGKHKQISPRGWQVAIQAGATESKLRNLDHGDRDSLGIFQMRPSMGWGTPEQLANVPYQVTKFYDVLVKVPNWETRRPGEAAQAVERSGFPERYHAHEQLAVDLITMHGGTAPAPGDGSGGGAVQQAACAPGATAPGDASDVIKFALAQQGKPYMWGATGPSAYDCSGLMLRAYESVGVRLPRTSREQYNAGEHVPVQTAVPGDLLFWANTTNNPSTIHHVAMYLGNGHMMEAQQDGVPLKISPVRPQGLMPDAVRPGRPTTAPPPT